MSGCSDRRTRSQSLALLGAPVFVFLTACQPDAETPAPQARPVRTVTVETRIKKSADEFENTAG
jgi:hypothetical protein